MASSDADSDRAGQPSFGLRLPKEGPLRVFIMGFAGMFSVLAVWQGLVVLLNVPVYLMPSPVAVAGAVIEDFGLLAQSRSQG